MIRPPCPRNSDILSDGRIVGINTAGDPGAAGAGLIHVVQNWVEELKARAGQRHR